MDIDSILIIPQQYNVSINKYNMNVLCIFITFNVTLQVQFGILACFWCSDFLLPLERKVCLNLLTWLHASVSVTNLSCHLLLAASACLGGLFPQTIAHEVDSV